MFDCCSRVCVCVLCMLLSFHSQCKSKFKLSLGEQNVASIMQTRITVCSHTHINYAMCFVVLRDMWNIWNSKHLKYKQIEWDKAMGSRLPLHIPSWHTAGQTNEIMHRLPLVTNLQCLRGILTNVQNVTWHLRVCITFSISIWTTAVRWRYLVIAVSSSKNKL